MNINAKFRFNVKLLSETNISFRSGFADSLLSELVGEFGNDNGGTGLLWELLKLFNTAGSGVFDIDRYTLHRSFKTI